ncbi:MAG: hypothetical protein VX871_01560 [Pseudomonadota bacterium]|nr:hypothetical protein [Pseudomonadota bacterium]
MTVNIGMSASPREPKWLRALLFAVAAVEAVGALTGLTLFTELHEFDSSAAQWLIFANLAVAPVFAIAALVFVIRGQLRHAIMALGALAGAALLLDNLPSIYTHGTDIFSGGLIGIYIFIRLLLFPLLGLAAAWLAWKNIRLPLAGILVSLPTLISIVDLIAFAVGVSIYGF